MVIYEWIKSIFFCSVNGDLYGYIFRELLTSGMEDFEEKLFSFLADHNGLVSMDRFKNVSVPNGQ